MAAHHLHVALALACACGRSPVLSLHLDGEGSRGSGAEDDGHDGGSVQTCTDVDFLFVIDNSGSMADNQAKVVANYDVFIGGIQDAIESVQSMHVGVITTDAYPHNAADCRALGGLVVATGGPYSSGRTCGPFADGHNFMTERDDLDTSFRARRWSASTDREPSRRSPVHSDFASIFPHGFVGPICAADYTDVFTDAVEVVKAACGE